MTIIIPPKRVRDAQKDADDGGHVVIDRFDLEQIPPGHWINVIWNPQTDRTQIVSSAHRQDQLERVPGDRVLQVRRDVG